MILPIIYILYSEFVLFPHYFIYLGRVPPIFSINWLGWIQIEHFWTEYSLVMCLIIMMLGICT